MKSDATQTDISKVIGRAESLDLDTHLVRGVERTAIGLTGNLQSVMRDQFIHLSGVQDVMPISKPYKLASREFNPQDTEFDLGGVKVGSNEILIIAGPCSVESRSQLLESMEPEKVDLITQYADVLQIGARNMQNFPLLHAAGESQSPVLLKRGISATVDELLMAAEYLLSHGNRRVIVCERGIRSYEKSTRNTTDINAIPVMRSRTHLPILLDPSHSTGHWEYVAPIARAGIAAGADGLIIEIHPNPEDALSDGAQSLKPERFAELIKQVKAIAEAVGRVVPDPSPNKSTA
jgi:3-deoxy-7-phosphoheptulonate synthase